MYLDEFKYKWIEMITCLKVSHTLNVCANQWAFPSIATNRTQKIVVLVLFTTVKYLYSFNHFVILIVIIKLKMSYS
jgi:hypothetical protein